MAVLKVDIIFLSMLSKYTDKIMLFENNETSASLIALTLKERARERENSKQTHIDAAVLAVDVSSSLFLYSIEFSDV